MGQRWCCSRLLFLLLFVLNMLKLSLNMTYGFIKMDLLPIPYAELLGVAVATVLVCIAATYYYYYLSKKAKGVVFLLLFAYRLTFLQL